MIDGDDTISVIVCISALKQNNDLYALWKKHSQLRHVVVDPEAEDRDAPACGMAYMRERERVVSLTTESSSWDEMREEDSEEARRLEKEAVLEVITFLSLC